jgi:hypothetical protein
MVTVKKGEPNDRVPPPRVRIMVPHAVAYNLEQLQTVTASVLSRLGCLGCHSGYLFEFQEILDFAVNPETLQVIEVT